MRWRQDQITVYIFVSQQFILITLIRDPTTQYMRVKYSQASKNSVLLI